MKTTMTISGGPVINTGPPSRVWMIHPVPNIDVADAKRFGSINYVSPKGEYLFGDEVEDLAIPEFKRREMLACVGDWDPNNDFLLLAGDHAQLIILGAMLARRYSYFYMLRYDRQTRSYFPLRVDT